MASGITVMFGPSKGKSLASDIASKIPHPSKLRKQKAMNEDSGEDESEGSTAAEAAFEAFVDAVRSGEAKAGVKAFKLLSSFCDHGDEELSEEEPDEDEA